MKLSRQGTSRPVQELIELCENPVTEQVVSESSGAPTRGLSPRTTRGHTYGRLACLERALDLRYGRYNHAPFHRSVPCTPRGSQEDTHSPTRLRSKGPEMAASRPVCIARADHLHGGTALLPGISAHPARMLLWSTSA